MRNNIIVVTLAFCLGYIGLVVAGFFFPVSLNWGFHFLGFLPPPYFIGYVLFSLAIIAFSLRGDVEQQLSILVSRIFKRPAVSVIVSLLLFVALAFMFRQRVPLLGDSFILINNLANSLGGLHALNLYREPLAMYYFYYVAEVLNIPGYPFIMDSFLIGELVLGIGFILNVIVAIKCLLPDRKMRILALLFLFAGTYMEIFFGYGEIYSVVLFFISLYVSVVALWIRQKVPFFIIPVVFMIQVFGHYLTVLLLPSLFLITFIEYRAKGLRSAAVGYAIPAVLFFMLLIVLKFDLRQYIPPMTHAPFLSIGTLSDNYQAYTLFSFFHLVDLFNLWMLLGFSALFLLTTVFVTEGKKLWNTVEHKFLLSCIVPVLMFTTVVNFDLGMAKDWDAMAPFFFLINLAAAVMFLDTPGELKPRMMAACIGLVAAQTMIWIGVNTSEESTVKRTKLLRDERIISKEGYYQHTFHLSGYYYTINDIPSQVTLWEEYFTRYPDDEKAFKRVTNILMQNGQEAVNYYIRMLERVLAANPRNQLAKNELINIHLSAGNFLLSNGKYRLAEEKYSKALQLNPVNLEALNNLGSAYMKASEFDSAKKYYTRAIEVDSTYILSSENLGKAYIQEGNPKRAVEIFNRIVDLHPEIPTGYENLAKVYYRMGEREKSDILLRQAARLGSIPAQELLFQRGIEWK